MLKVLHNHIFASKLRDVFASSPLVLVYQTVGTVDVSEAAGKLQAQLDAALPAAGLRVRMCRMRNSVAAGAGDPALARLFQASNLIVGFGPGAEAEAADAAASSDTAADGAAAAARAGRRDGLGELLGGLFGAPGTHDKQQQQRRRQGLEHRALAKAFNLGAALPGQQPLVLLGAFYGRESIRLAHLKEWVGLDETRVRGGAGRGRAGRCWALEPAPSARRGPGAGGASGRARAGPPPSAPRRACTPSPVIRPYPLAPTCCHAPASRAGKPPNANW
jgi:hypothetical protein